MSGSSETYVSVDIEADGPVPGANSMLSLGSAAFRDGNLIDTFQVNLLPLPGAYTDSKTMKWWASHEAAWEEATKDQVEPGIAMQNYADWLSELPRKLVCIGYPATYDFMWISWYLHVFIGYNPFGHSALDLKTFAMAILRSSFKDTFKSKMPSRRFGANKHTHRVIDDAIEQGEMFIRMTEDWENSRGR